MVRKKNQKHADRAVVVGPTTGNPSLGAKRPSRGKLARCLDHCVTTVQEKLGSGPDAFLASRQTGADFSRECLASLFKLASSLHSPRLPYYSRTLETSSAQHVTIEQIWGQMNMLLRPVLRRLKENIRRMQETSNGNEAPVTRVTGNKRGEGSADAKCNERASVEDVDACSQGTSQLDESDLDKEISSLLAKQRDAKKRRKSNGNGDESWRYVFGKDNEESETDVERSESLGDKDEEDCQVAGHRRQRTRARGEVRGENFWDGDDQGQMDEEELEALKEMYGEDFVPHEDEYFEDEGDDMDVDDPLLEEDLKWDDPTAALDEEDSGTVAGGKRGYVEDDNILEDEEGFEGDRGGNDDEEDPELQDPNLTDLQRERLREKRLVERLEQERLYSTQWAMSGEVSGSNRPRDALLDESLDFEYATKAVPVITEGFTAKLEDRIRRRVLDSNYDDVQRRTALSAPGDLAISRRDDTATKDSEKSRLSLMDLYEKEYLEKARKAEESTIAGAAAAAQSAEPLTEIEKDELRAIQMWRRLAQHLDALSNFHYTPKPVHEDLAARVRAVEGQAPAIALEAVGNFAVSRESALAPQDLYRGTDRKFADVGVNELEPRERRAVRRAKKDQAGISRAIKEKHKERAKKLKEKVQSVDA